MTIKPGERYESAVWLDADGKPLPHLITKVARGHVYYRPDYGAHEDGLPRLGNVSHFPVEQAGRWLGRKLEEGEKT